MREQPPHNNLSRPFLSAAEQGNNHWLIVVFTLFLVLLFVTSATAALLFPLMLRYPSANVLQLAPAPLALTAALLPFAATFPALWLALRFLHRRPFRSLITPAGAFRWRLFAVTGLVWFALAAAVDAVQYAIDPSVYRWSFDAARFLPYLLAALLLMPIQTCAEELVFRGYLTQVIGVRARRLWLPLVLPSLFFALLHLPNPEVGALGLVYAFPQYLGIGLLLGWITLRSQGLEMAFGLHLANNLYSGLVASITASALPTASLFTIENLDPMLNSVLILIAAVAFLFIASRLIRRERAWMAALLPLLLAACSPLTFGPAQSGAQNSLPLEECLLTIPGYPLQVEASCGTLDVPEDPANPGGRMISLHIAVIKAESSNPEPDPIFMLAGGPGQAATQAYLPVLPAIERVTFKRDVVLVDQRGTGQSNPLQCDFTTYTETPTSALPTPEEIAEQFRICVEEDFDADPRFYTTDIAMQDLEAVRVALGYDQINLIGVSYGTRAALTYMRLYPENVRTAVLDGVVPPGWLLGQSIRADAQQALDRIFARCAADDACQRAFPDLQADFTGLLDRLAESPSEVTLPDPSTGEDTTMTVTPEIAGAMVRLISYSSHLSALLPWLVHTAAEGDLRPLAAQYLLTGKSIDGSLEEGMFYAVVCREDVPFLPPDGEQGDYFFYDVSEIWRAACSAYPSDPQPQPQPEYPVLQAPVLIVSGEADPVTPPANGEALAQYLPNSRHIVLAGMGHGNFHVGCVPNLVRQLVENASLEGVDTTCIERNAPLPFFLNAIGPQP